MSQSDVSPTTIPEADPRPEAGARAGWPASRVAAIVIGSLLALLALTLLGAAGTALWADRTQRDGGYVATEETELGTAGVGWLYGPGLLGKVRIRVTPQSSASRLFVGIGRSADVDRYLAGVGRTVISDFFKNEVERVDGGPARSAP